MYVAEGNPGGSGSIVAAGGALWVSEGFDAALDRIDRRAGRVTGVVPIGLSPWAIAADGSAPAVITDAHATLKSLARHRLARVRSQRTPGGEPAAPPAAAGAD